MGIHFCSGSLVLTPKTPFANNCQFLAILKFQRSLLLQKLHSHSSFSYNTSGSFLKAVSNKIIYWLWTSIILLFIYFISFYPDFVFMEILYDLQIWEMGMVLGQFVCSRSGLLFILKISFERLKDFTFWIINAATFLVNFTYNN